VISIGGLTAGGSGKTPVAAEVATWLREAGWSPALLTTGLEDEMRVLERLAPGIPVLGGRDRLQVARRVSGKGADVAVLDSGFQHRSLDRTFDLVCVDGTSWSLPGRRRLPAGPFRERIAALARADAVVLVERGDAGSDDRAELRDSLRRWAPGGRLVTCRIDPVGFRPANELAESVLPGPRAIVVAGVMWPDALFAAVRELGLSSESELAFADHEAFGPGRLTELAEAATAGGVVCSLKDAVKLGPLLAGRLAVWYVEERAVWTRGGEALRRAILRRAAEWTGRPLPVALVEGR
jgi:tetraacyldisaccharide 4'-kinase